MERTRPSTIADPVSRAPEQRFLEMPSETRTVRAVSDGTQTSMLIPHTVPQWAERMRPGFVFTLSVRTRSKPYSWRVWATVEVTAACAHDRIGHIHQCEASHRPERIEPGRTGWAKIKNRALHPGGQPSADLERSLANGGWTVVDLALVDAGKERTVPTSRPKQYRNATERELAEDNRYYEWLKLAAERVGETHMPSPDEVIFRAKSAAYNKKLTAALANGDDTRTLAVTDAEVEAELPKFERRART
jgi:hypothetical protein